MQRLLSVAESCSAIDRIRAQIGTQSRQLISGARGWAGLGDWMAMYVHLEYLGFI